MASRVFGIAIALFGILVPSWASEPAESEYLIGAPDVLEIRAAGIGPNAIAGKFQVQPDGRVELKKYGCISVAGLTVEQARAAVATLLAPHAKPQDEVAVLLAVTTRASKVYYVIIPEGNGKNTLRFSLAGDETVVNAVLKVEGLAAFAMDQGVSIVRPSVTEPEILTVDWKAITQEGRLASNYQLRAGDRIFVGNTYPRSPTSN